MGTHSLFISYSKADQEIVTRLVSRLQAEGVEVWVDYKEIGGGESVSKKIGQAIKTCLHFVVVLSESSAKAPWVEKEVGIALSQQLGSRTARKVIPIRLDDCEVPPILSDLAYVDFRKRGDFGAARGKLLDAVGKTVPHRSKGETHLLISEESPFTRELKKRLIARKADLGIGYDAYGSEGRKQFQDYQQGLRDFLHDETSEWLFTVHPEDDHAVFSPQARKRLIDRLLATGKRMVCFESGTSLKRTHLTAGSLSPVVVIQTDYLRAVKDLIHHAVQQYLCASPQIQIVTLLGPPGNSAADERNWIYHEFVAAVPLAAIPRTSSPGREIRDPFLARRY